MGIFKNKEQKPCLVLINPDAWNLARTYRECEAYALKKGIRREFEEFPDGHTEVRYFTSNPIKQIKMGLIVGGHTAMSDMTLRPLDMDGALTEARRKAGVRG